MRSRILASKQNLDQMVKPQKYCALSCSLADVNHLKGPVLSGLNLARTFVFGVSWLGMAQIGQLAVNRSAK